MRFSKILTSALAGLVLMLTTVQVADARYYSSPSYSVPRTTTYSSPSSSTVNTILLTTAIMAASDDADADESPAPAPDCRERQVHEKLCQLTQPGVGCVKSADSFSDWFASAYPEGELVEHSFESPWHTFCVSE